MKQQNRITPVYFNVEDVGKNIKQTKKRFTWMLEMDQKIYTFVLDASMISGKVKLTCNNQIVAMSQEQPLGTFTHTMLLDTYQIVIMATGENYEMRINNQVFSHMLNQIKTKTEFIKNQQACEDIVVDEKITRSNMNESGLKKTIKLKIGSMKSASKSSAKSMESEDWGKMMGEQASSFPNYFEMEKNGQSPQEIDYSKVSMKKKSTQAQMTKPEEPINLMEENTHVIEITPQQFCTMQQMFRTQVPMQMKLPQTSNPVPQYENLPKQLNPLDFSTMQMLFQTQCGTAPTKNQTLSTEPVQININVQDFSTMQWMFNTMNLGAPQNLPQQPKKQQQPLKASCLLDELCSTPQTQTPQTTPSFNMADFSTMQMMFATNNMNVLNQVPATRSPLNLLSMAQQVETKQQTQSQMSSMPELNPMDFSTMANMFKTMNFTQPQTMPTSSQQVKLDPLSALGLSNSSNNANIQPINISDFSTMQMLFKTNGMGLPSGTVKSSTSGNNNELKQNSVPLEFQF